MQNKISVFFDNLISDLVSLYIYLIFKLNRIFLNKFFVLKKNIEIKNIFLNEKIFLIGNSPGLLNYDLKKIYNKNVIMVNRSFFHKDYNKIKPDFHIFIDPKIAKGTWSLKYFDIIFKKNPKCKIILDAKFYYLKKFIKYRNDKRFYWIYMRPIMNSTKKLKNDLTNIITNIGGVVETSIIIATYLGCKDINIIGVEGNGISKLMCNQKSHFNGKDKDYSKHLSLNFSYDMISSARTIRQWYLLAKILKKKKVRVFNLMKEGIFDAFEHKKYFDGVKD